MYIVTANRLKFQNGTLFRTCEDGAGWHLISYRISPRSESFSQSLSFLPLDNGRIWTYRFSRNNIYIVVVGNSGFPCDILKELIGQL